MYRNVHESFTESANCSSIEADMFLRLPDIRALGTTIYRCSGCSYKDYNELLRTADHQKFIPTGTCLPFSKKIFLSVNGKILPCERVGHHNSLGKVDADGVTLDAVEISRKMNRQLDKIRSTCMSCYRADTCVTCIHNMDKKDLTRCPSFMDVDDYSRYLSTRLSKLEENPEHYSRILDEAVIL